MRDEELREIDWSSKKDLTDLLMREYTQFRQEINLHIGYMKNHVRNSQIFITSALTIVYYLSTTKDYALSEQNQYLWIAISLTTTTITYYLLYDIIESFFSVQVLSELTSSIESQINSIIGTKVIIYESSIAQKLWPHVMPFNGVLQPNWVMGFYPSISIFAITIVFPLFIYYSIWKMTNSGWVLPSILLLCGLYSVISILVASYVYIGTLRRLRHPVRHLIDEAWKESQQQK